MGRLALLDPTGCFAGLSPSYVRRVEARARTLLRARTATLPGATHHSIPAAGADRIARELLVLG